MYDCTDKWFKCILAGLAFMLFASPYMFKLTQKYIGSFLKQSLTRDGVPTLVGLAVNGALFVLFVKFLIY